MLRQVTLDRANRRKDRSVSITFITDLEEDNFMEIDEKLGRSGIVYFKDSGELTQKERRKEQESTPKKCIV
jgi:hypothetical protein